MHTPHTQKGGREGGAEGREGKKRGREGGKGLNGCSDSCRIESSESPLPALSSYRSPFLQGQKQMFQLRVTAYDNPGFPFQMTLRGIIYATGPQTSQNSRITPCSRIPCNWKNSCCWFCLRVCDLIDLNWGKTV